MKALKYKILNDYKLIIRYLKGQINMNDLYSFIDESKHDENFNSKYSVLYDIRDAEFLADRDSILEFSEKFRLMKKIHNKRKITFLTNNPKQVVFAIFIEKFRKLGLYEIRTFSTLDAALDFLNIDKKDFKYIEKNLSEMSL